MTNAIGATGTQAAAAYTANATQAGGAAQAAVPTASTTNTTFEKAQAMPPFGDPHLDSFMVAPPPKRPVNPFQQLLDQIRDLLRQLMQLTNQPIERPIPSVPPTVFQGQNVGMLESKGRFGGPSRSINVEDVVSAHTSEQDAIEAARRYSSENGEAVAIVRTVSFGYPPLPTGRIHGGMANDAAKAAMPAPPGGVPVYTYNVVTLDPAVGPRFAGRVLSSDGATSITALVEGNQVARTNPNRAIAYPAPPPVYVGDEPAYPTDKPVALGGPATPVKADPKGGPATQLPIQQHPLDADFSKLFTTNS